MFAVSKNADAENAQKTGAVFSVERFGQNMLDRLALILVVVGALNWGGIGLFKFDAVAWLFGGQDALLSRIVYTLVALAGVWCISLIFRPREREDY